MSGRNALLCILVLIAMVGQVQAQSAEDEIRALSAQYLAAAQRGDAAAIAALFAPDGLLMPPNAPAAEGRDAIAAVWAGWVELPGVSVDFAGDRLTISEAGDLAAEIGHYIFAFDTDSGRFEDEGKYVVVWQSVDGQWRVIADILNSNVPMAEAE